MIKLFNIVLFSLFFLNIISCEKKEEGPESCDLTISSEPVLSISSETIGCTDCELFGKLIDAENSTLVIADAHSVFILNEKAGTITARQQILFCKDHTVWGMQLYKDWLGISIRDDRKNNKIYIFKNNSGTWEKSQEIFGRGDEKEYGTIMQFSTDWLLYGSLIPEINEQGIPAGSQIVKLYFYVRNNNGWVPDIQNEVAIFYNQVVYEYPVSVGFYEDWAMVLTGLLSLHIYRHENTGWQLNLAGSNYPPVVKMVNAGKYFLVRTKGSEQQTIGFTMNPELSVVNNLIVAGYNEEELSDAGEVIEMNENTAVVYSSESGRYFLLSRLDDYWQESGSFEIEGCSPGQKSGLAITGDRIYAACGNTVYIHQIK